jgi:signal transduction histidine kinase
MSAWLPWELGGWACAAAALGTVAVLRHREEARLALVAEASHELRGPVTAVQLGLAGLARDAEPERARRAAALDLELRRAGLALADLAAAPAGRRAPDRPGPVDVADVLAEAAEAWTPVARAFGGRIELEPCTEWWVVRADRVRLAQALGNLVANAIEHGRPPVVLRARRVAQKLGSRWRTRAPGSARCPKATGGGAHAGRRGHGLAVAARVAAASGGRLVTGHEPAWRTVALELPLLPSLRVTGAERPARLRVPA